MYTDELESAVRKAVASILAVPPASSPQGFGHRGLVLFTGGIIGFDDAIKSLRQLQECNVNLDYIQTPSAQRILDQNLIQSMGMRNVGENLVTDHDILIIPTLTANICAKVATGVADCLASNVMAEFIMSARPVVASRSPVCPDGSGKREWYPNIPDGYAQMLKGNLTALVSFGVRLTDSAHLCRTALDALGSGSSEVN